MGKAQPFCAREAGLRSIRRTFSPKWARANSELFMADLLNRNSRIEEDLIDQLFNSSEKRLARVLLLLANFGKEGGPEPIVGKFLVRKSWRRWSGRTDHA